MKLRELTSLMAFYKTMHPRTQPHELLKIGGFKIAGLEGTESLKPSFVRRGDHRLAWHKIYDGVCTCCQWQSDPKLQDDAKATKRQKIVAQHGIHARLAKRQVLA